MMNPCHNKIEERKKKNKKGVKKRKNEYMKEITFFLNKKKMKEEIWNRLIKTKNKKSNAITKWSKYQNLKIN